MKLERDAAFQRAAIMTAYLQYRQQDVLGQRFAAQPAYRLDINYGSHLKQAVAQQSIRSKGRDHSARQSTTHAQAKTQLDESRVQQPTKQTQRSAQQMPRR